MNHPPKNAAATFFAHIAWVVGGVALTLALRLYSGLVTFTPTTLPFFRDLNYSSTVVTGLWMLGLVIAALFTALQLYRRYSPTDRFPGQLGPLLVPPSLRLLRILFFFTITAIPLGCQIFLCARMFAALEIVHNDVSVTPADTKRGLQLLKDFGITDRSEGNSIFHGWHWHSWNDDRPTYPKHDGIDAWPGVQPLLFVGGTALCVLWFLYLAFISRRTLGWLRSGVKVVLFLGLLGLVGWYFLGRSRAVVDGETQIARIRALDMMLKVTEKREVPQSWAAGVFLANDAINRCLTSVTGKTLVVKKLIPDTGIAGEVEMTVRNAVIDPTLGTGLGRAIIEANIPSLRSSLTLEATFWFGIVGFILDPKDPGAQRAVPTVQICDLTPSAAFGDLLVQIRGRSSHLLTAPLLRQLNLSIADALKEGFALPIPKSLKLAHQSHQDVPAGEAKIALEFAVPETEVPIRYQLSTAIATRDGVWLLAGAGESAQPHEKAWATLKPEDAELPAMVAKYEKLWSERQKSVKTDRGRVLIWASESLFSTAGKALAQIPPAGRTLQVRSRGYTGHLYEKEWRDKILGKGGVKVDLASASSLSVTVECREPTLAWSAQGLAVSAPLHCVATGAIHVHLDPLIGGGAGTSVGIRGETSTNLQFVISMEKKILKIAEGAGVAQVDTAVVSVKSSTPPVAVEALTDGKFVLDWGWTKVPQVGLKITQPIPEDLLPALVVCDNRPLPSLDLSLPADSNLRWKDTGAEFFLAPRLGDFTVQNTQGGIIIGAVPELIPTAEPLSKAQWRERHDKLQVAAASQWESENGKARRGDTSIAVVVGPIEFGPNNDLVVFLRGLGKSVEEIAKVLKDIGEEVSPQKIREWIERPGESIARSDIGRAARTAEHEAKVAAENAARESKRVADNLAREAARAAEEAKKKAGEAKNWVSKRTGIKF